MIEKVLRKYWESIEKVLRNIEFLNGHKSIEKSEHWEIFLLRKHIEKKIEKLEYAPPPFYYFNSILAYISRDFM